MIKKSPEFIMIKKYCPLKFLSLLGIICFGCLCHKALAEEMKLPLKRIITDQKGRKLDVTILAVSKEQITLRRTGDGKEFTLDMQALSENDRSFFGYLPKLNLKNAPQSSQSVPSHSWYVDDFGKKLKHLEKISVDDSGNKLGAQPLHQLSLALGHNGPVVACIDWQNIQMMKKTGDLWDSGLVDKVQGISKTSGDVQIKIAIDVDGNHHLVCYMRDHETDVKNIIYKTHQNGSWATSSSPVDTIPGYGFSDMLIADGKCKVVFMCCGFGTYVFECDKASIKELFYDGGHLEEVRFIPDGRTFGISRWDPRHAGGEDSSKIIHFSESSLRVDNKRDIIKTFGQHKDEEADYCTMLATDRNGKFSVVYSSKDEFFRATRTGEKVETDFAEGNWSLNDYSKEELGFVMMVAYEMVRDGNSYMFYNTSDGHARIARFLPDGHCVIDDFGEETKALSLALDTDGNPHVLYQSNDGYVNYARCKIASGPPSSGGKPVIRNASLISQKSDLRGYINPEEKPPIAEPTR